MEAGWWRGVGSSDQLWAGISAVFSPAWFGVDSVVVWWGQGISGSRHSKGSGSDGSVGVMEMVNVATKAFDAAKYVGLRVSSKSFWLMRLRPGTPAR